jgi:transposase
MRFVELKAEEQLDMQTLHRVRDRLVGERTALLNQLRAVLLERGIAIPQGRRKLEQRLDAMLGAPEWSGVASRMRSLLQDMRAEWRGLDRRIEAFDEEFAVRARSDPDTRRLATIPGIGVLNATALVAAIGNKRGNKYLRKLLIHGARAAMPSLARSATALGGWLRGLLARAHPNTVVVALANKLARIVWAVLRHGREFERADVVVSA